MLSKSINELIQQFRESIPNVRKGHPSKDWIDDGDVYLVAEELLARLDRIDRLLGSDNWRQYPKATGPGEWEGDA